MKPFHFKRYANLFLMTLGLASSFTIDFSAQAASVALATQPLATTSSGTVQPNVLLVLDNSGSMDWDHMPDDANDGGSAVTFSFGYYGLRSSQCNQVYYDPTFPYTPPVDAAGNTFSASTFTAAYTNGFNTGAGTVNLNTGFRASQSMNGDGTGGPAYYYSYSGAQTTQLLRNYNSTSNTFYSECSSAQSSATGMDKFTKVVMTSTYAGSTYATIVVSGSVSTALSSLKIDGVEAMSGTSTADITSTAVATNIAAKITLNGFSATASGSTITISGLAAAAQNIVVTRSAGSMTFASTVYQTANATNLTNFANWYSYYRTRMLMMKTATGRAFSRLDNSYRVGLMQISSTNPIVELGTFETTARSNWYSTLYAVSVSGSTPLRTALSNAGRYYAGKLTATDPMQYYCQQNFSILSTDGYWNAGDGYKMDGSTLMDNEDGVEATHPRAMFDGATSVPIWTNTYTRNSYSKVTGNCTGGKKQLQTQPQIGSCTVTTSGASCTPGSWSSNGSATLSGVCLNSSSITYPAVVTVLQSSVATTGSTGGSSNSLADVAMYYYQTDLRDSLLWGNCNGVLGGDVCQNDVRTSDSDDNKQQHMTTFTLGLGASGWMNYSPTYTTDSISSTTTPLDFPAVKLGSVADSTHTPPICSWQANGTTCNWPLPGMTGSDGYIANVDDLWHAAVDGHGGYFSATNPTTLATGLASALAGVDTHKGSAAAAATSTLNPVSGNNMAYIASYTTNKWKGNLEGSLINTDTGVVNENAVWCVENIAAGICNLPAVIFDDPTGAISGNPSVGFTSYCLTTSALTCNGGILAGSNCYVPRATTCTGTMNTMVSDTTDTRIIKTPNSTGTGLVDFVYANLKPTDFDAAHIGTLSQWTSLTTAQQTDAAGAKLVDYLRGQWGNDGRVANSTPTDHRYFRLREAVLGDPLDSQPTYIADPTFSYSYSGYSGYVAAQAGRAGTVYIGVNDGMLHAFDSITGIERWAYVPSMVISNMWKLADNDYANLHANYVNGSPATGDICIAADCTGASYTDWRSILVGGLNGGGRGYYALDITVPTAPVLLWEFTTTAGIGKTKDDDLGYGFGKPVITRMKNGTWVVLVTSGYNNTSPGTGQGFLYVLNAYTGALINKISTGVGTPVTPSGLAKIAAWNDEGSLNGNLTSFVYGGDLQGNVWRFDINNPTTPVMLFASLYSNTSAPLLPQPIMTKPVLGQINNRRAVFIGTGKYLEKSDINTTQVQSEYAILDDDATTTLVNPRTTLAQQTLIDDPATSTRSSTGSATGFSTGRGWYADFPDSGERVNIDSQLVQGILVVPTITPSSSMCAPGGTGWLNYFDYKTGSATGEQTSSYIVGMNILFLGGEPALGWVGGEGTGRFKKAKHPPKWYPPPGFSGTRAIWHELLQ